MRKHTDRPAFTLVELLVVIGIIALLISVLLPALNKARQAAQTAQCQSNLRQVSVAITAYQAAFKGMLCRDYTTLFPKGLNRSSTFTNCPNYVKLAALINPTIDAATSLNVGQSYGWNVWIDRMILGLTPSPWRSTGVKNSAELALMGDTISIQAGIGMHFASSATLNDVFEADQPHFAANKLSRPSFQARHGGRGAVLWLDGHVSMETPTFSANASDYTGNGQNATPDYYIKNKIGFIAPAGTALTSKAALYYFLARKDLANDNSTSLMMFRGVFVNGTVYIVPKRENWN